MCLTFWNIHICFSDTTLRQLLLRISFLVHIILRILKVCYHSTQKQDLMPDSKNLNTAFKTRHEGTTRLIHLFRSDSNPLTKCLGLPQHRRATKLGQF